MLPSPQKLDSDGQILVENLQMFTILVKTFSGLFIFFHVEENEPKEDARAPFLPARRRRGRRTRKLARHAADSDSPRSFSRPHRRCSARDKGNQKLPAFIF